MGTVSGVYLKYVALSASSYASLYCLAPEDPALALEAGWAFRCLLSLLAYISTVNALVAALFRLEVGMEVLGKESETGHVPWWSYVLFAGFHLPTWVYTNAHHMKDRAKGIAAANEVAPGWWIGGCFGHELGRTWAGIVDLTCEFPESCRVAAAGSYMLLRCWDGVPPTPAQLEEAAEFAVKRRATGDVIVHCAHGRGRSTTAMCACLVRAGLFKTWQDAYEGCRAKRKVVKLNARMRGALEAWQQQHQAARKHQ